MIVRDEEARLPAALDSAAHLVDEIIVVDTGSTDGTRDVAAFLGARVLEHAWDDDFAAARNASLEAARSDWILVLDADETLEPVAEPVFRRLLADDGVAGYEVALVSERPDGRQEFSLVRLFRNHPAVRYRFRIHEQIIPALNEWAAAGELKVAPSPLVIRHEGYGPEERAAKRPRNRRLLAMALVEHPDEPYLHFQAGAEGVMLLDGEVLPVAGLAEARRNLEKAWELLAGRDSRPDSPWIADLLALLGSIRLVTGRPEEARLLLNQGRRRFPEDLRLAYLEGLADPAGMEEPAPGLAELRRWRLLGERELLRGGPGPAAGIFRQALAVDHEYTFALLGMARCEAAAGRFKEALPWYLGAVTASEWNWRAWLEGAELMTRLGLDDQARTWRDTFNKHFPEHPAAESERHA